LPVLRAAAPAPGRVAGDRGVGGPRRVPRYRDDWPAAEPPPRHGGRTQRWQTDPAIHRGGGPRRGPRRDGEVPVGRHVQRLPLRRPLPTVLLAAAPVRPAPRGPPVPAPFPRPLWWIE